MSRRKKTAKKIKPVVLGAGSLTPESKMGKPAKSSGKVQRISFKVEVTGPAALNRGVLLAVAESALEPVRRHVTYLHRQHRISFKVSRLKSKAKTKGVVTENLSEEVKRALGESEKDTRKVVEAIAGLETGMETLVKEAVAAAPRKMTTVVVQEWLESESGWGQSDDGISIHFNETDRAAFSKAYWASMPPRDAHGHPPSVYSRESGSPYIVDVEEGGDIFTRLTWAKKEGKHGIREFDKNIIASLARK